MALKGIEERRHQMARAKARTARVVRREYKHSGLAESEMQDVIAKRSTTRRACSCGLCQHEDWGKGRAGLRAEANANDNFHYVPSAADIELRNHDILRSACPSDDIEVFYDGQFPNACSGTLTINVNGVNCYEDRFETVSTGGVCFTPDWEEVIEDGELVWVPDEKMEPSSAVRQAVKEVLDRVRVCCGGCV